MRIDVRNSYADLNSYRAARVKSLFNVDNGSDFSLTADLPIEDDDWNIGMIVGPSGSGKTSMGRQIWDGAALYEPGETWQKDKPIVDAIAPDGSFDDLTASLSAVGLSDVPAWLRPYHVLSNGERFRADLARSISEAPTEVIIDEFSSVVDRQVAKIGADAFAKGWRHTGNRAILLSCHYDIIEWVQPDWVFDTASGSFQRGGLQRRPPTVEQSIQWAIQNYGQAEAQIEARICTVSFYDFVCLAWRHIDPDDFVTNWHIKAICDHLQALIEGRLSNRKVMINAPPGSLKSMICSVMFPAWCWITRPWLRFMCTAYRADLALRDSRRCRDLIDSDWYHKRFGGSFQVLGGRDTATRFENDQKGYRLAVPISGIMGDGGDIVLLDDPHNVETAESDDVRDEVVRKIRLALPTRVRSWRRGGAICIMQRLHWKDYCGTVIEHESDWDHLCFPARFEIDHPFPVRSSLGFIDPRTVHGQLLNPGLVSEERLRQLEIDMGGSYGSAGQMQQRPTPREGGMFKRKWWQYCSASDVPAEARRCRGWDFAGSVTSSADYSASSRVGIGDGKVYLEHMERFKATPGELEQRFVQRAEADGYGIEISIPQDPGQAGKYQPEHMLGLVHGYVASASPESGSKEQRAKALAGQAEAGNVIMVRGEWNETFVEESSMFPMGANDDLIDATSRSYHQAADYGPKAGVW